MSEVCNLVASAGPAACRPGRWRRRREQAGVTLAEALIATTVIGVIVAGTLPAVSQLRSSAGTAAAARSLATALQAQRWEAIADARSRGMYFDVDAQGWHWYQVADGNGNGLRTAEVRDGTDATLSGPHRLGDGGRRVGLGFPGDGPYPRIPPSGGVIGGLGDPVQFGSSNIVSFSPLGTCSSGTLYVSDGQALLFGVVVYGATGRVRVWRYTVRDGTWRL